MVVAGCAWWLLGGESSPWLTREAIKHPLGYWWLVMAAFTVLVPSTSEKVPWFALQGIVYPTAGASLLVDHALLPWLMTTCFHQVGISTFGWGPSIHLTWHWSSLWPPVETLKKKKNFLLRETPALPVSPALAPEDFHGMGCGAGGHVFD